MARELSGMRRPVKSVTYPLRLTPQERDALEIIAERNEITTADLLRFAMGKLPGWDKALKEASR